MHEKTRSPLGALQNPRYENMTLRPPPDTKATGIRERRRRERRDVGAFCLSFTQKSLLAAAVFGKECTRHADS